MSATPRSLPHLAPAAAPHERACSIALLLEQLGDGWCFLILRSAFFGETRFEGFVQSLSAPRTQISQSLARLVEVGVLQGGGHPGYRLTASGHALFSVCIGLMAWGDKYARLLLHPEQKQPPLQLFWREERQPNSPCLPIQPQWICAHCQKPFSARDCVWVHGPGSGVQPRRIGRYRPPNKALYAKAQPCSVASALEVLGDRWIFLILREAFFGHRRFEDFVKQLGISRNVLTERLETLQIAGVLKRHQISAKGLRTEYQLTHAGLELYPLIVAMMNWCDQWLREPLHEPLIVIHRACGTQLHAKLVDAQTGRLIESTAVRQNSPAATLSTSNLPLP